MNIRLLKNTKLTAKNQPACHLDGKEWNQFPEVE